MNLKISLAIVAVVAAVVGALLFFNRPDTPGQLPANAAGKVTVVEFLDLECPACGAAFPGVEKLREEYHDKATFEVRHFPIPSHTNGELAATAVEAAGDQGKRDEMYRKLFQTQQQWAGQEVSHRATFVGFAKELGLDTAKFEQSLDAPATVERVRKQREEGTGLGVKGTPTFFINGEKFTKAPTYANLKTAIDEALNK